MGSLATLLELRQRINARGKSAVQLIRERVEECPELLLDLDQWQRSRGRRFLGVVDVFAEQLCILEDEYTNDRRERVIFGAGACNVADDLLNSGMITPEQGYLFVHKGNNLRLNLFYTLDAQLKRLLPEDFLVSHFNIIEKFNQAQAENADLGSVSSEELVSIRYRIGGYSMLMLYSLLFPDRPDISWNVPEDFCLDSGFISPKEEILYNLGVLMVKIDDLYDRGHDIRSLATEGHTEWRDIPAIKECIFEELAMLYGEERIARFERYFDAAISRTARAFARVEGVARLV